MGHGKETLDELAEKSSECKGMAPDHHRGGEQQKGEGNPARTEGADGMDLWPLLLKNLSPPNSGCLCTVTNRP